MTPNYLMIDMVLKNKSGISYTEDLQVFVMTYGVKGFHNDVSTSVWDKIYTVTMLSSISMRRLYFKGYS